MQYERRNRTVTYAEWGQIAREWSREGGDVLTNISFDTEGHFQRHIVDHGSRIHAVYTISDLAPRSPMPFDQRLDRVHLLLIRYMTMAHDGKQEHYVVDDGRGLEDLIQKVVVSEKGMFDPGFILLVALELFPDFYLPAPLDLTQDQWERLSTLLANSPYSLQEPG